MNSWKELGSDSCLKLAKSVVLSARTAESQDRNVGHNNLPSCVILSMVDLYIFTKTHYFGSFTWKITQYIKSISPRLCPLKTSYTSQYRENISRGSESNLSNRLVGLAMRRDTVWLCHFDRLGDLVKGSGETSRAIRGQKREIQNRSRIQRQSRGCPEETQSEIQRRTAQLHEPTGSFPTNHQETCGQWRDAGLENTCRGIHARQERPSLC